MDQIKIGKFIAEMRKKQNFSQKQIAEQIGVTDKTISKWETGGRMPDASILLELCAVLKIDVNELLAGENFPREEQQKKIENNIINLVGEINETRDKSKGRTFGIVVGIIFIGLGFIELFTSSLGNVGVLNLLDLPTLFFLLGLVFLILVISGWFYNFINALKYCFSKNTSIKNEVNTFIDAVKFAGVLTFAIGWLISVIGIISAVSYIDEISSIGPSLAQAVLSVFYTVILEIIYVIIYFRIKKKSSAYQCSK